MNDPTQSRPPARGAGFYAGIVLLGAGLLAVGIVPRLRQGTELAEAVAHAKEETTSPVVEVIALDAPRPTPTPAPGTKPAPPPDNRLRLPATVQAIEQTVINARTTGYLRKRYVDIGARVKSGQLLAEIESPDVDQQLAQAQAQVAKSQAGTGQANADVARLQAGVAQAQAEVARNTAALDQARSSMTRAKAMLQQAKAGVAQAQAKKASVEQVRDGKKADLVRDRSRLILDEKDWQRYQALVKEGAISQQSADTKQSAYESSQATVTATESAVRAAETDVNAADEQIKASEATVLAAQSDIVSAQQSVRAAEAQVSSSQANLRAAQASVTASRSGVRAAEAQVGADAANVNRFRVLREFEKITAPFSGVITARNADTGSLINAGGSGPANGLFGLARTDVVRVLVNVPQTYVSSIKAGQTVTVTIRELPGRTFQGSVFSTSGALDPNARTLLTDVRLSNMDSALLPGMYAEVRFAPSGDQPHGVRIPANTLVVNASGTQVVVVGPNRVLHFVPVTLGRDYGTEIEVVQGLDGHESLVVNPTDELQDGMTVQIAKPAAEAHPAGAK